VLNSIAPCRASLPGTLLGSDRYDSFMSSQHDPVVSNTRAQRGSVIRIAECYRFFLPLVLMTELNMISKSAIHAFLARTQEPDIALAAFNISFAFYYTLASATEATTLLCISYLNSKQNLITVLRFMMWVLSVPIALSVLVVLTPLGDWVFGEVFGASAAVVKQAKTCTWVLSLSGPVLIVRGCAFALLMLNSRTLLITASTLVRLLSLGVSLSIWPHFVDGAVIGAAALTTCMAMEALFAAIFALRHVRALPARVGEPPGTRTLWGFSWPLMLNQGSEIGIVFVINLFLGRLLNADLALAAFGVVHGLVGLIFSPMRNLVQATQTLVETHADVRVMLKFALQLAIAFSVLALVLFNTPLQHWVLSSVMGLNEELTAYSSPAVSFAFAMAIVWALSALCRGLLANQRRTRSLGVTAIVRLLAAVLVGSILLVKPEMNGAVVGLSAWMLAYALEVLVLGRRLTRRAKD
jgi:Na+-driven multidrug efflux pump